MTFSIIGRCPRTRQIGIAVSTSSLAVGSRCAFARAGAGAVLTQARTDPRLGPQGLELLATGATAPQALATLIATTPHIAWRQLAIMDRDGGTASYTGPLVKPWLGEEKGQDCVLIGNILANANVLPAMLARFLDSAQKPLAERLLLALEAALAAGGEPNPVRSAALLVVERESFPLLDLRIDAADQPILALRRLWQEYAPWTEEFVIRAIDPDRAAGTPATVSH